MGRYDKERKYKRIKINKMSKINNSECSTVNISRNGMMLTGDLEVQQNLVHIQLRINGKWIDLEGKQMWAIENSAAHYTRLGVFITSAPKEYEDFVDNLYLEADKQK